MMLCDREAFASMFETPPDLERVWSDCAYFISMLYRSFIKAIIERRVFFAFEVLVLIRSMLS
jgi:hypothetical protein